MPSPAKDKNVCAPIFLFQDPYNSNQMLPADEFILTPGIRSHQFMQCARSGTKEHWLLGPKLAGQMKAGTRAGFYSWVP